MERGVQSVASPARSQAGTVVSVFGILLFGCGDSRPASALPSDAAGIATALLERLAPKGRGNLDGVLISWTTGDQAGADDTRVLAAIGFPDRMRLEIRQPGNATRVIRRAGNKIRVSAGRAPAKDADVATRRHNDRLLALLGTLCGWDLRSDTHPKLEGSMLVTRATWLGGSQETIIRRELEAGNVTRLSIGDRSWSLHSSNKMPFPDVDSANELGPFTFTRFEPGQAFAPSYFDEEAAPETMNQIVQDQERKNFKRPLLAASPAAYTLTLDDPGSWDSRLERLDTVGRKLFELGQMPVGLPSYGDRKMVIYFQPQQANGKPRVPKGQSMGKRPAGHVLVLYAKATLADATKQLSEKLRVHATRIGLFPADKLRAYPYVLPGGAMPNPGDPIVVRGELLVK